MVLRRWSLSHTKQAHKTHQASSITSENILTIVGQASSMGSGFRGQSLPVLTVIDDRVPNCGVEFN